VPGGDVVSECREQFVGHVFEDPASATEELVSRIIAEVLGIDRVGRTDSFYDFGGTSLNAIRICARIESAIGCQAEPIWLFTTDVVADFVAQIVTEAARPGDSSE
jgi:acyl carrier protein